jgi:uncharacterized protein YdhG (YjbR/CyaY superfamily)
VNNAKTIEEYLLEYPLEVQEKLLGVIDLIQQNAPDAIESINYGIPTFKLKGKNLIHTAIFKKHIGLYPGADGVAHFEKELKSFKTSKGAIQFPLNQPIPEDLVVRIVQYRVKKVMEG